MDNTRHQLMDSAGPLFAERGFRTTTVREICELAKANQAAINYHFGDKENLYIECVRHAAQSCMTRTPMPAWPDGTPPAEKLRDFVRMFLHRVAVDHEPEWHGQLIMREMLLPTQACAEFVKNYVHPTIGVLRGILNEMLPMNVSDRERMLIGFSIVGQILHYRSARPVLTLLVGPETFRALDVETLTEHITAFSLLAIEGIAKSSNRGDRMIWIALKMLMGDRAKYLGLIFGVTFATLLMTQQISIFMGIIGRTASQIDDIRDAEIWVMDNKVRYIDEVPGLADVDLQRVRSVPGVAWAVKLYKGQVRARLRNGNFRNLVLFGLDDATFVGAPKEMIIGELGDLNRPDAVVIDKAGYEYMWPGEPYVMGREFELNDRRAVLVGVCKASPPFTTMPILYTRYSTASGFVPKERHLMTFVLAQPEVGQSAEQVCRRIEKQTNLLALTQEEFFWKTVKYFLSSTGIPVNFGITILLGFVVGAAITGQTFYLFTIENLKQFGSLKAMGVSNLRLVMMILVQALVVGILGYGFGIGLTAAFFEATGGITHLAGLHMTWLSAVGVGFAVLGIISLTALMSIHKVLVLEPAVVFR